MHTDQSRWLDGQASDQQGDCGARPEARVAGGKARKKQLEQKLQKLVIGVIFFTEMSEFWSVFFLQNCFPPKYGKNSDKSDTNFTKKREILKKILTNSDKSDKSGTHAEFFLKNSKNNLV